MISVVIPLYNKEKSIKDTVQSVLNQTYQDFELIIVNDGSNDDSLNVIQSIKDPKIRIINKENAGVSSARNEGIQCAKNEYISFLDGDDIWSKDHLQILANAIMTNDSDQIGGFGTTFYKSKKKEFDYNLVKESKPNLIKDYFTFMSTPKSRFNSSTLMVKKSKVIESGLFNENLKYGEDVELWYRLFKKFKLVYIDTITTIYFIAAENRSAHYTMPLEKRFHVFDYNYKTKSEKKYLDKLLALIIIDYSNQKSFKNVINILRMYPNRILGSLNYVLLLINKKLKR